MRNKKIIIGLLLSILPILSINYAVTVLDDDLCENIIDNSINLSGFLEELSFLESSNTPDTVNRLGYIGKYQLGQMALKDLGVQIKPSEFKRNPNLLPENIQDSLVVEYMKLNKKYLGSFIDKYRGKKINGIVINEGALLGGAHLVGYRAVKEWLQSNGRIKKVDGNGTNLEKYLKHFNKYKIEL